MNSNKVSYIKIDDTKFINESCILWIKKVDDCFEINSKQAIGSVTDKVCKSVEPYNYDKIYKKLLDA
jgi:hypothetical protein